MRRGNRTLPDEFSEFSVTTRPDPASAFTRQEAPTMTRTVVTALLFPLLALCSCSSTLRNGDPGRPTAELARNQARESEPLWIPDDVRHDPGARASLMEQLRVQILQKTQAVPEANRLVVREQLRRQLNHAGFDMEEVVYILSSLDQPRGPLPETQMGATQPSLKQSAP
jgi:hypothetical protein